MPGRDARWPEEQAHLSLGQEGLTPACHSRSTHPVDLSVRRGLPPNSGRLPLWCCRPATARPCTCISMRSQQGYSRRARDRASRSSRLARRQGAQRPKQHLAHAAAAARARTQRPGKHLEVHATELALKPDIPILRRYRRTLLLCLEHPHRSAVEDHVRRTARLGQRGLLNVRIGISRSLYGAKQLRYRRFTPPPGTTPLNARL